MGRPPSLQRWYDEHGRHDLAWRHTRDPWLVLVSEVMLHQTQVGRVAEAWPGFAARFATPEATAAVGPGAVIRAWGRLGYPRRARRLYDAAVVITRDGWPADLTALPGIGRYTAAAVRAQAFDDDVPAVDVNIRRVTRRVAGHLLNERDTETASVLTGRPLRGRDRLLALMDVGALVCRPRDPQCGTCPLAPRCATRGPLLGEGGRRQAPYTGSMRERRGRVLEAVRAGPTSVDDLDAEALASLVADGLARMDRGRARLP